LLVDLTQATEAIFHSFSPDTRYKIRRAESKDAVQTEMFRSPDTHVVREFVEFHRQFSASKGISPITARQIAPYIDTGSLQLSRASIGGQAAVWHSHVLGERRARLRHSVSLFRGGDSGYRNLVGRANRLLHWRDMLFFKSQGIMKYDFGGWYAGTDDAALVAINRFKHGFGGSRVVEYNASRALTGLGRLYMLWTARRRGAERETPLQG
jgi:hypothetical protein